MRNYDIFDMEKRIHELEEEKEEIFEALESLETRISALEPNANSEE